MINDIIIDLDNDEEYLNDYDDNKINDNLANYIMDSVVDLGYDVILNIKFKYKVDEEEINNDIMCGSIFKFSSMWGYC